VKLGRNASDTCAVLSEAYGGETMKRSSDFEWHNRFKESSHVEMPITLNLVTVSQAYYAEILKRLREAVHTERPELWPNDWNLQHDSSSSQGTLCQTVSGPEIDY
jgi:hypothetical protein